MTPSPRAHGFTLIELLVVIAIIGLLSSIVLASLNTARAKGRDATRQETLHSLQTALELYANDHSGQYPATGWVLIGSYVALATYLPTLPHDPEEGTVCKFDSNERYGYYYASDGTNYKLVACSDNQVPASSSMYDSQRPGMVFMVCQASTNTAYCGNGV